MNTPTITSSLKASGFCLFLILECFGTAQAQEIKWPVQDYGYGWLRPVYQILEGYIVTDGGDTVRGFIRTSPVYSDYPVFDTAAKRFRTVRYGHIVCMRLFADSTKRVYTDWLNIGYKGHLWILLAKKNQVAVYQNTRQYGPWLILSTPNGQIRLIHKGGAIMHNDNDFDAGLLRFIRKRYKSKYTDFVTTGNIYAYIVEKENEKMGTAKGVLTFDATLRSQVIQSPKEWLPYGWQGWVASVQQGYIVTNQSDTLTGLIRISPHLNDYPVLESLAHTIRTVNLRDIEVMRVYSDSSKRTYTDWFDIHYKSRPWILLAKKNDVALYENTRPSCPLLILVTPRERIKPIRELPLVFHGSDYNAELRRFIRKRYNTSVEDGDMSEKLFAYIVEKENERIAVRANSVGKKHLISREFLLNSRE
jgi:hypothetical protein